MARTEQVAESRPQQQLEMAEGLRREDVSRMQGGLQRLETQLSAVSAGHLNLSGTVNGE